ncbi:DUF1877 family protein [Streptomyces sp. NPDC014779]|uniref:DUF1877 family protein n=1 Tax=unclassified Streptomyces TaxID=2593676 RepID=UPI0033AAD95F
MSIYLHFRAVAMAEIRDDHGWLAAFMFEAWENRVTEYAAGLSCSINKGWDFVNDLYTAAAPAADTGVDDTRTLPVYGGRPVPHTPEADPSDPPMMLLEPREVSAAARFLSAVSFDELWAVVGATFTAFGWTKEELLHHHRDLEALYGRAATAGHAVVKVVWA